MQSTSPKFRLNARDYVKGAIVAIGSPIFFVIRDTINAGHLELKWESIVLAGLGGAIAYLGKNFFTDYSPVQNTPAKSA